MIRFDHILESGPIIGTREHPAFSKGPEGTLIRVKVTPRANKNELGNLSSETIRVKLTAPPIEGKANRALVKLLACMAGVSQKDVEIVSGQRSRQKRVQIRGLEASEVLNRLGRENQRKGARAQSRKEELV